MNEVERLYLQLRAPVLFRALGDIRTLWPVFYPEALRRAWAVLRGEQALDELWRGLVSRGPQDMQRAMRSFWSSIADELAHVPDLAGSRSRLREALTTERAIRVQDAGRQKIEADTLRAEVLRLEREVTGSDVLRSAPPIGRLSVAATVLNKTRERIVKIDIALQEHDNITAELLQLHDDIEAERALRGASVAELGGIQ